ncbi:hypothetical protein NLX71_14875 [Paenibacillus sp. MZ04-78.2]|uniref:hypothetical protein n=1 Tax=Paenibacillus sp. MZ04-78.2 TaxID=2962034 RepID=UPI0020B89E00|nr:hypothetical protein [Paenibacillus sp. MZ04-78.2]MCP3774575.1 hypothetical protein [Paenibacillus sp. MZ04-78.2]
MRKIAYFMHIDWGWIKQRPHFLAEELQRYYNLNLFYIKNFKNKGLTQNKGFNPSFVIYKFPFSSRFKIIHLLEIVFNYFKNKRLYSSEYDTLWITSPLILQFVNLDKVPKSTKVIYDCMDDMLAFPQSSKTSKYMGDLEEKLINRSDFVFVSSKTLGEKLNKRGVIKNLYVVNNGIGIIETQLLKQFKPSKEYFNIFYFGTIAGWFDFEILLKILNSQSDVIFTLVGPCETAMPFHPRLKFLGPVNHSDLFNCVQNADAFIMPFKVNELVLSVDPVKVYEYLFFNKPCIIVKYPETIKFEKYVYLYSSYDELHQIILDLIINPVNKTAEKEITDFLQQNTWKKRAETIVRIMEEKV